MSRYHCGQRVTTPKGAGIVVGFERFTDRGQAAPLAQVDDGKGRVVVRLDDRAAWVPTAGTPDPYFFRREVTA